jgi:hypothetical protein
MGENDDVLTPQRCLSRYGRAWFERDPDERIEALRRCCTEDIVFMDYGLGRFHGLEEVSAMIGRFISGREEGAEKTESTGTERGRSGSGVSVEVVTDLDVRHGFLRYSFVWSYPDGTRTGGTDFCEFAPDGRMRLITVWPATDDFPLPAPA